MKIKWENPGPSLPLHSRIKWKCFPVHSGVAFCLFVFNLVAPEVSIPWEMGWLSRQLFSKYQSLRDVILQTADHRFPNWHLPEMVAYTCIKQSMPCRHFLACYWWEGGWEKERKLGTLWISQASLCRESKVLLGVSPPSGIGYWRLHGGLLIFFSLRAHQHPMATKVSEGLLQHQLCGSEWQTIEPGENACTWL